MALLANMDLIAHEKCETTEGPLWHEDEQALYFLDIPPGKLFRHEPGTGETRLVHDAGEAVGGFTLQDDGAFLLFGNEGSIRLLKGGEVTTLRGSIEDEAGSRFNDVIADPDGRVFCGTMPHDKRPGRLYRLDTDGTLTLVLEDAGLSNGMGFSPELDAFYHTDSDKGTITRFDYHRRTGELSKPKVIVTVPAADGVPDGMAIDAIGTIWSGIWDGQNLVRFGPEGTVMEKVWFPARKVSSVTFGGEGYTDAYVTLAGGNDPDNEGGSAGAVYKADLGVAGRAPFRSRIDPSGEQFGNQVVYAPVNMSPEQDATAEGGTGWVQATPPPKKPTGDAPWKKRSVND
ncbi:MAG: SMP-30/gluconolactonase/LRE family protein [Thermomicrobiales bacterium]